MLGQRNTKNMLGSSNQINLQQINTNGARDKFVYVDNTGKIQFVNAQGGITPP